MHDKLFANQQHIKRDDLDGYAKELGLDMDKCKTALDSSTHKSRDRRRRRRPANDDGISGTPAFVIVPGTRTGYYISGAQPYAKFRKLIDRAIAEAK